MLVRKLLTSLSIQNVKVPGGQRLFVKKHGSLGFTQAHSARIPDGALQQPFKFTPGPEFSTFQFDDHGFLACPTDEDKGFPYQVFVTLDSLSDSDVPLGKKDNCIGFEAITISYGQKFAAWQYI